MPIYGTGFTTNFCVLPAAFLEKIFLLSVLLCPPEFHSEQSISANFPANKTALRLATHTNRMQSQPRRYLAFLRGDQAGHTPRVCEQNNKIVYGARPVPLPRCAWSVLQEGN